MSNSGEEMKITVWRNATDIDLIVGGEPATHRTYQNFRLGKIASDRYREDLERRANENKKLEENKRIARRMAQLGRVRINLVGQRMALWRGVDNNIKVIFEETGSIVDTTWYAYRNGMVTDPVYEQQVLETLHKVEQVDDHEKACQEIFENWCASPSSKMAEAAITQTAKGIWGKDREEFKPKEDESDAYKRACEVSRKLDGCATSLRMYSITAIEPARGILETLAKAAMNASLKLREKEATIDKVFGEIGVLAQTARKSAEEGTGNLYMDDALRNTAEILDGILK